MVKLKLTLIALLAALSFGIQAEEPRYVTENFSTYLRAGDGDNFRIVGSVQAGDKVTLLKAGNKYAQIIDSKGRQAWILLDQLSTAPSLSIRVPELEAKAKDLSEKLANIDNTWNQKTADMQQKVASSDGIITQLQQENAQLKTELDSAKKRERDISLQLDDKQRTIIQQWFMYGGGVAGIGLILGLILPYLIPRRRKNDRWMN